MANIIFSEEAGLNDSIFGKSQAPIRAFLEARGEAFEKKAIGPKLFKKSSSKNWAEKYGGMTAMEGPKVVGENGVLPVDGYQEGFSKLVEHEVWKDSFAITREAIDDAKLNPGKLFTKPKAFLTAHYRTMEKFAAAYFGTALTGATSLAFADGKFDLTSADGVAMFSGSHPSFLDSSFTQSNQFDGDITAENIFKLETAMQNFKDDNGNIVDVAPDTIIIPNIAAEKYALFTALGSSKDPDTANNTVNPVYGRWNVIVWPYLNQFVDSGDTPWIMMDSDYCDNNDVAVWLDRVNLEIESRRDPTTKANVWDSYCRFGCGFVDWRGMAVCGIDGATALS